MFSWNFEFCEEISFFSDENCISCCFCDSARDTRRSSKKSFSKRSLEFAASTFEIRSRRCKKMASVEIGTGAVDEEFDEVVVDESFESLTIGLKFGLSIELETKSVPVFSSEQETVADLAGELDFFEKLAEGAAENGVDDDVCLDLLTPGVRSDPM